MTLLVIKISLLVHLNSTFFGAIESTEGAVVFSLPSRTILPLSQYVLECAFASFKCAGNNVIIAVFYRPSDMGCLFSDEFSRVLGDIHTRFPTAVLIIFGDFNFPANKWSDLNVPPSDVEAHKFLPSCPDFSFNSTSQFSYTLLNSNFEYPRPNFNK